MMDKLVIDQSRTYRQLLKNELDILRESSHPKIMKVYELLEDVNFYYVISELIEGGSVMNRMRKMGKPFSES
jgi:serine/threonine protein kinase